MIVVSADGRELLALVPPGLRLLGLSGSPGAGKTTLAGWLARETGAVVVPMDGFHLPSAELARRGLLEVKGAPETFDAEAYAGLLDRVAHGAATTAPAFEHGIGEAVPDAIRVPADGPVLTEGNYLLLPEHPWPAARAHLGAVWHLVVDDDLRVERLLARAIASGKPPDAARAWVGRVDRANADRVERAAADAAPDLVLDLTQWMM